MLKKPYKNGLITAQKINFSAKDFFTKCEEILIKLRIWSHLLRKFFMEIFIFYGVLCMLLSTISSRFRCVFVVATFFKLFNVAITKIATHYFCTSTKIYIDYVYL